MKRKIDYILFDLDGTLIDSARAILSCYQRAFEEQKIEILTPLSPALIGPPLRETLAVISGTTEGAMLDALANAFIHSYDTSGYQKTDVFPGVNGMLNDLKVQNYKLYVVTNKRERPTLRILDLFQWHHYFEGIYSLDTFSPALKTKAELIARVAQENGIAADSSLYVGDRNEDGLAATVNKLPFCLAGWGYLGNEDHPWQVIAQPDHLVTFLNSLN